MKHVNTGSLTGLPMAFSDNAAILKTKGGRQGLLARTRVLLSFALLLSLQLISGKAGATALTTTGFSSTRATTATTGCVTGFYASGWSTAGTDYWQYTVSTSGYSGIQMSVATSSSATGPHTANVYYNVGGSDVFVSTYTFTGTTCSSSGVITLPAACNNQPSLIVRIKMNGASASAGTNRINSDGGFTGTATSFCSGTPGAGTVSGATAVCGSGATTLTLTPGATGADLTYQWYNASGVIPGATNVVYTTPVVSATTTYSVVTSCPSDPTPSTPATAAITVNALPAAGTFTISSPMIVGTTQSLTVSGGIGGGTWSSSNTSAATVSATGVLTAVSGGSANITYKVTDATTGCQNIAVNPVSIVWPNTLALYAGHDGNSTDVTGITGETVSTLTATSFGPAATPCTTGGLSGLTVNTTVATYSPAGPYVSYIVTPTPGNALNAFEFHVSERSSGTGPTQARLAYRINGGSWIDEGTDHTLATTGSCGANTNIWYWTPSAPINGITTNIEIALFPYHSSSNTGTFQVNALEIIGVVSSSVSCTGTPAGGHITPLTTVVCSNGYESATFAGDAGVGISYQWQSDSITSGSFVDIAGANNVYYHSATYAAPTTIHYRVLTTCASAGTAASDTATLSVVAPPTSITPTHTITVGQIETLTASPAGGSWSSQHFSIANIDSASGVDTGLITGITVITYSTAGIGCSITTTVSVIEPNSIAVYLGTGGNSTSVTSLVPAAVTVSTLTTTGFGVATSLCSAGGVSGLTVDPSVTSFGGANPHVLDTITVIPGNYVSIDGIYTTVRASATGAHAVELAYSLDNGTTWMHSGDLGSDIQSCGVSTVQLHWAISIAPTANVLVAVYAYSATSTTGTFQVNSLDVTGTTCAAPAAIIDVTTGNNLNGEGYNYSCADGITVLPLSTTPGGGSWTSSDPSAIVDPMTGDLYFADPGATDVNAVITYTLPCGASVSATVTVSESGFTGCTGYSKHAATTGVATAAVSEVNIYPNPAGNTLNIAAAEKVNVTILSMDGRILINQVNATNLNVRELASGVYMIQVYNTANSLIKTTKFTKQ